MLKVLHLLSSDRFSGAENVVCQIITAFDGDSEVEHLYVSPEGPIRETLKEKNIRYVPVKSQTNCKNRATRYYSCT